MNKNVKGAIVIGSLALTGYLVYVLFFSYKRDKALVVKNLNAEFGYKVERESFINEMPKAYVKSWAKAIREGNEFFFWDGKKYNTSGGKVATK
jgi:hypothetical protein